MHDQKTLIDTCIYKKTRMLLLFFFNCIYVKVKISTSKFYYLAFIFDRNFEIDISIIFDVTRIFRDSNFKVEITFFQFLIT